MNKLNPNKLIELVRGNKVYIQTHNFPDPDAIATAYGLQNFLKYHGIDTTICYDGKIDKLNAKKMIALFEIELLSKDIITNMGKNDYIITVDVQKYNSNITDFIGRKIACIDHHPKFINCEYEYEDIRITGACSSIIAKYFYDTNTPMNSNVATALTYGIKIDTSEFLRGVTTLDIEMFGKLFELVNKEKLTLLYTNIMEFKDLKAYAAAIKNIELNGKIGFAYIPFDCADALIAMISDFILLINVVNVVIVYSSRVDGIKFSVRSEVMDINAGKLIKDALDGYGNGGGHHSMGGGFMPSESVEEFDENIHYEIRKLFLDVIDTYKVGVI